MYLPIAPRTWAWVLQRSMMQCAADHLARPDCAELGHDAHVLARLQRGPSIGCSLGAGRMWWECHLWAAFHGDGAALRDSTPTFAGCAACAQLGRGVHVVGRSSEAGASRPNAFGFVSGGCTS